MSLHRTVGTSLLPTSGPIFSLFVKVSTVISADFLWSRGIAQVSTTQRGKEVRQSVCSTIFKKKVNASECLKTEAVSRIKISQNQKQIRMHATGGVLPSILIIDSDGTSLLSWWVIGGSKYKYVCCCQIFKWLDMSVTSFVHETKELWSYPLRHLDL